MNACETAVEEDENTPASEFLATPRIEGLASAFTSAGADAYVGAPWPVFDDSAKTIARSYYEKLCSGETAGVALQLARKEASGPDRPLTWASYVLFGKPDSRLLPN
jgi:CHAT domain-containing protein